MSSADAHIERLTLERTVLFTDAVFAIVMTLMAIEIKLPAGHPEGGWTDAALAQALADLAPKLLAYVISFVVVALIWTAHLRKFRALQAVDGFVIWMNLAQLLFIGLMPFSTALLAEALTRLAIVIYAANLVAAGLAGLLSWRHAAASPRLAGPCLTPAVRRREARSTAVMVLVFAASIAVAVWQPQVAMFSWIAIWPGMLLVRRYSR